MHVKLKEDKSIIIDYLEQFYNTLDEVIFNDSPLKSKLLDLIAYYKDDSEGAVAYYLYTSIKVSDKPTRAFGLESLLYLLERRQIIIHDGLIRIRTATGTEPITTSQGQSIIATEFSLTTPELNKLMSVLSMIESITQYRNRMTGAIVRPTLPKEYLATGVQFNDCVFDLHTLKPIKPCNGFIPFVRIYSSYKSRNQEEIQHLRNLLLFIADYDWEQYQRLLKIIAYPFTRKKSDKMFVFLGKGRNGKGVLLEFINRMTLNKSHTIDSMMHLSRSSSSSKESEILEILTSQATLVQEEKNFDKELFDNYYKNMVTGGKMTGRKLGANSTTIANQSTFFVATNYTYFDGVTKDDYAFRDRVVLTDFDNKFMGEELYPQDSELVFNVVNSYGKYHHCFNFKNILQLLIDDIEDKSTITFIPSQKSQYIKGNTFESDESKILNIYNLIADNPTLLVKNRVKLTDLKELLHDGELHTIHSLAEDLKSVGLDVGVYNGYAVLRLDDLTIKRYIEKNMLISDFNFHTYINDYLPMIQVYSMEKTRITEVMFKVGVKGISKRDLIDYFTVHPEFEVEIHSEQPFITYVPQEEEVIEEEPTLDIDGMFERLFAELDALEQEEQEEEEETFDVIAFLDSIIAQEEQEEFKVSVFKQGAYPRSGVDFRDAYTSDIESLVSPPNCTKEGTWKLFPYDIETRGGEIQPSQLLALDFDEIDSDLTLQDVLDIFKRLGYDCYLQESYSSTEGQLKIHCLVKCTNIIDQYNYKSATQEFTKALPFNNDDGVYYKTIMNISSHPWYHIEGTYFDTSNLVKISKEMKERVESGELKEDRSHYTNLLTYLVDSNHENAKVTLETFYQDAYDVGNRDNTVFKIATFLNDSYVHYNMPYELWHEAYSKLLEIVGSHPVNDNDKRSLIMKINNYMSEVSV